MKMKTVNKRLVLKKQTIGNLCEIDMAGVHGGQEQMSCEVTCQETIAPCEGFTVRKVSEGGATCN